jgi:hypothetical protein
MKQKITERSAASLPPKSATPASTASLASPNAEAGRKDLKLVQPQEPPPALVLAGLATNHFVCNGCGIKFKSVSNLQAHQVKNLAPIQLFFLYLSLPDYILPDYILTGAMKVAYVKFLSFPDLMDYTSMTIALATSWQMNYRSHIHTEPNNNFPIWPWRRGTVVIASQFESRHASRVLGKTYQ